MCLLNNDEVVIMGGNTYYGDSIGDMVIFDTATEECKQVRGADDFEFNCMFN